MMHRLALVVLLFAAPLAAFAGADITVYPRGILLADPAAPFRLPVTYFNVSQEVARDVRLVVHLPPEVIFVRANFPCGAESGTVTCDIGTVGARVANDLVVELMIPPLWEGTEYDIDYQVFAPGDPEPRNDRADTPVWVAPTFAVTNSSDSGPGSLRQAILDANATKLCEHFLPCKITFRIPGAPERGWHTIRPLSPLPVITADPFMIDGTIQTWLSGDSNPLGPEIELNGELAGGANGLEIDTTDSLTIQGLCINGWAGNGIEFVPQATGAQSFFGNRFVTGNYIGTDPTGTTAVPNGWRGVSVFGHGAHIVGNVISGNLHSGIFFWSNSGERTYQALIRKNRIGVAAHGDDPIPNGASGILIGPEAMWIAMEDNVIAHNAEYGIALAQLARNELRRNRIFANRKAAVDLGLDGDTPLRRDGGKIAVLPLLTSAIYDPATNTTIVEGRPYARETVFPYRIELYASDTRRADGRGEAERLLTATPLTPNGATFRLKVAGDLRGSDITATLTQEEPIVIYPPEGNPMYDYAYQTSELSAPIEVR